MADMELRARVSADLSTFERELSRGPRVARQFSAAVSREAAQALAVAPRLNTAAYQASGDRAGRAFSTGAQRSSATALATAPRPDIAAFAAGGTVAGRAFTAGVEREVATSRPFAGLAAQAKLAGGAIAIAFGARAALGAIDEYTNLHNKLRQITGSAEGAAAAYRQLLDVAQATRTDIGATVDLYTKLGLATRDLGTSQETLRGITTTIGQAFAVSGTDAATAAGAIRQLGQALEKGNLNGDELVTLREGAPLLLRAIREAAGGSAEEFAKMAEQGQITTELMVRAFEQLGPKLQPQFDALATTLSQARTQMRNAFTDFVGGGAESSGTAQALAGSLSSLAHNFNAVATAALAAGVVMTARTLGRAGTAAIDDTRRHIAALSEERQAIVRATFAEQARAAGVESFAMADRRQTEQRITNLRRVEAELVRVQIAERARLASAATVVNQSMTPGALPRGLPGIERELARRAAAEAVVERSSRQVLQLDVQRERVTALLAAETGALAAAERAEAAASGIATGATARHTAALAAQSMGARAAATATRLGGLAVSALGGPIGIGIIAITGLVLWFNRQKQASEAASRALDDYKAKVQGLPRIKLEAEGNELRATLTKQVTEVNRLKQALAEGRIEWVQLNTASGGAYNKTAGDLAKAEVAARGTMVQFKALNEASQSLAEMQGLGNLAEVGSDARAKQLAQLRDMGIARDAEMAEIRTFVEKANAELAKIGDDTSAGAAARRILLTERVQSLTRETKADKAITAGLKLDTKEAKDALREFTQGAEATVLRLNVATELGAGREELATLMADVVDAERRVTEEVARRGGVRRAETELLQAQIRLQEATALKAVIRPTADALRITPVVSIAIPGSERAAMEELTRMAQALAAAMADVDMAKLGRDSEGVKVAEDRVREVNKALDTTKAAVAAAFGAGLRGKDLVAFVARLQDASDTTGEVAQKVDRLTGTLRAVGGATRGVLQIADAFGDVNDNVRRTIDGLSGMLAGIADAREAMAALRDVSKGGDAGAGFGDLFGSAAGMASMVSIIGGAVGLIGSLVSRGPSATEVLLKANNDALDKLRDELNETRNSLGDMSRVMEAARQVPDWDVRNLSRDEARRQQLDSPRIPIVWANLPINLEKLNAELAKSGLTFRDMDKLAKEYGIALQDEKGKLRAEAFGQLAEQMDLARQAAMRWADDFAGLSSKASVRADLFNLDSPADAWNDAIGVAEKLLPKEIADQIRGFDISTDDGRAAARDFFQKLFTAADAGTLSEDILAKFGGIKEFSEWLLFMEQPIDDFASSLDNAAESARRWADGLAGAFDRADFAAQMFDVEGTDRPQFKLDNFASVFADVAPELFDRIFAGVETGSAEGRRVINDRLNEFVREALTPEFRAGTGWLADLLESMGVSWDEVKGSLLGVDGALDELAKNARAVAFQLKQDFASLSKARSFIDDVFDRAATPELALGNAADMFAALAPALYERIFAGIDQGSAQGRGVINQRLNELVTEMLSEEFQAGQGWLSTVLQASDIGDISEFMSVVLGADNALDSFTSETERAADAAKLAADAMLNLPAGFRKGQLEWLASLPGVSPYSAVGGGSMGPARTTNTVNQTVEIVVNAAPGENADSIIETINARIKSNARARYGAGAASVAFQI